MPLPRDGCHSRRRGVLDRLPPPRYIGRRS